MGCALCKGELYGPCPACGDGVRRLLSDQEFKAKLDAIRARGVERIARLQAEAGPRVAMVDRHPDTGLPTPVGDVGPEREAQAAPVHLCDGCAAKALEILEECGKREADLHRSSLDALIRLREDFAAEMGIRLGHRVVGGEG